MVVVSAAQTPKPSLLDPRSARDRDVDYLILGFKDFLFRSDYSESTIKGYVSDIEKFIQWMIERGYQNKIGGLDKYLLQEFFHEIVHQRIEKRSGVWGYYSNSSILRIFSSIKKYVEFCSNEFGFTPFCIDDIQLPEIKSRDKGIVLGISSLRKLFQLPEGDSPKGIRDKALLALMVFHAVTVENLHVLDCDHIELDNRVISLPDDRFVNLNETVLPHINRWLSTRFLLHCDTSAAFISLHWTKGRSQPGKRLSRRGIRQTVDGYLVKLGLKEMGVTCKALNKTGIALGLKSGLKAKELGSVLACSKPSLAKYSQIIKDVIEL